MDGSDEFACSILSLPEGYRKGTAPPPPTATEERLSVLMEVALIDFSEIDVAREEAVPQKN